MSEEITKRGTEKRVVLIGNPNVGKSVIFKQLTGQYVTVSNYPGTTVELAWGKSKFGGSKYQIIDTPGINSLLPFSEDEKVARDLLLKENQAIILQVADAKNLRRTLWLTLQLAELGIPMTLALNIMDEAADKGVQIDVKKLSELVGIETIPTIATQSIGIDRLIRQIPHAKRASVKIEYDQKVETAIAQIEPLLPENHLSKRGMALLWLCGDEEIESILADEMDTDSLRKMQSVRSLLREHYLEPLSRVFSQSRLAKIDQILADVLTKGEKQGSSAVNRLGKMAMHPFWGLPILALVLFGVYEIVGIFGAGTVVDLIENGLFGKVINPFFTKLFELVPLPLITDFFVGEYGMLTMGVTYALAIVLPVVGFFFIVFGILEDSGYLPRLAIMVDKLFRLMGLNGKAVLPMVLGLGCDTMATLTTRILESKKERIIVTLLLALAVPCSAQLGVTLGLLASLSAKATLIWLGVLSGILFLVGFLASRIVPGKKSDFILEIPPLRVPKLSNIVIKTVARVEWYLKEAAPIFVLGTVLLFVLDKVGALILIEKAASPVVVGLLNLPQEATQAFLVGFLRRDYGAAGFFVLSEQGKLDPIGIVVSLVVITLFIPCIANLFVMIKERGLKTALSMVAIIVPLAFLVGALVNFVLRHWQVAL
ncbi:MAG: ferrous iron transport protein B [candidate division Zixibacteria bacterium RBG_16_50_21]|nr:MAG: ferrous iron transport protein B [candidate division Zixibacteria bacterium RBG_16_50_21]